MVELNETEIKEIRELLSNGFDIKLISMELDISISRLQELIDKEIKKEEGKKQISVATTDLIGKEGVATTNDKVQEVYKELIQKYKKNILENPQKVQEKRNLLAFAYFKAGLLNEARDELMSLIESNSSYMAYRQLIYIENEEGNFEDAKLWAYEALDKYPDSIPIRKQLISIARIEQNDEEVVEQLKKIEDIREKEQVRFQSIVETSREKLRRKIKGQER